MSEIRRILDQMDRAFAGEAWHGPSLKELLDGISAEDASKHTIQHAHSIWEIVNHIAAWNKIVRQRLEGEFPQVTPEMDWPDVWDASEPVWKRSLENLFGSRALLRKLVEGLRDDQLDEKIGKDSGTRYFMLHGLVQHDLYHAGQIAILKKALR
ncbi:MAG TPA: DinB family protein [Candidatus Sulfotelmatobacter sp.]|nr:DinB family protein [Candidatus Sulfotelmatobacter sp.]